MSDVRSFQRDARAAIDKGEHTEAESICEYGLEVDRSNYLLLVFKGLAQSNLNKVQDAISTYQKAIKVDSKNILAWQGLLTVLEKCNSRSFSPLMIDTLKHLRDLLEGDKQLNMWHKLANALEQDKQFLEAIKELESLGKVTEVYHLRDRLIDLWRNWEQEEIKKQIDAARFRLSNDPLPVLHQKITKSVYAESRLTQILLDSLIEETDNELEKEIFDRLYKYCPEEQEEFFEKLTCKLSLSHGPAAKRRLENDPSPNFPTDLLQVAKDDPFADYLLPLSSRPTTLMLPANREPSKFESYVFAKYLYDRHLYDKCLEHLDRSIKSLKNQNQVQFIPRLRLLKGLCLYNVQLYEESLEELSDIKQVIDQETQKIVVDAYDKLGRHQEAANLLPSNTLTRCWQLFKAKQYEQCELELCSIKDQTQEEEDRSILQGLVCWHYHRDRAKFLKLVPSDTQNPLVHFYLGQYYYEEDRNLPKALNHLQSANQLDPSNLDMALLLCEVLLASIGTYNSNYNDLDSVKNSQQIIELLQGPRLQGKRHWQRFLFLGLAYFLKQHFQEAASFLHDALKCCPPSKRSIVEPQCLRHLIRVFHQNEQLAMLERAILRYLSLDKGSQCNDYSILLAYVDVLIIKNDLIQALRIFDKIQISSTGDEKKFDVLVWLAAMQKVIKASILTFNSVIIEQIRSKLRECFETHFQVLKGDNDLLFLWLQILHDLSNPCDGSDNYILLPSSLPDETDNIPRTWQRLLNQSKRPKLCQWTLYLFMQFKDDDSLKKLSLCDMIREAFPNNLLAEIERDFQLSPLDESDRFYSANDEVEEDESTTDGSYWLARYQQTKSEAHLLRALELLTDPEDLQYALKSFYHHASQHQQTGHNEVLISALERILTFSPSQKDNNLMWAHQWLGILLEREGLLQDALTHFTIIQDDINSLRIQKQLLPINASSMDMEKEEPINQVRILYHQGEEYQDEAWALLRTAVPKHWSDAFLTAIALESDLPLDNDNDDNDESNIDIPSLLDAALKDTHLNVYQRWQFVKLAYYALKAKTEKKNNENDHRPDVSNSKLLIMDKASEIVIEFFKSTTTIATTTTTNQSSSFLQNMWLALEMLRLDDDGELSLSLSSLSSNIIKETIKERYSNWQECYDPNSRWQMTSQSIISVTNYFLTENRFKYLGSKIGQQMYEEIKNALI